MKKKLKTHRGIFFKIRECDLHQIFTAGESTLSKNTCTRKINMQWLFGECHIYTHGFYFDLPQAYVSKIPLTEQCVVHSHMHNAFTFPTDVTIHFAQIGNVHFKKLSYPRTSLSHNITAFPGMNNALQCATSLCLSPSSCMSEALEWGVMVT